MAGGAQAAAKRQKSRSPLWPIRMFCGLPMTVMALPALHAPAKAMRNGRGSRPRRRVPSAMIGAIAKAMMSFASTADSSPATTTTAASRRSPPPSATVMRPAAKR